MNRSTSPQKKTVRARVAWLFLLLLVTGAFAYPTPYNWLSNQLKSRIGFGIGTIKTPFVLGLDLQGGTHLEYEADVTNIPDADRREALNGVRDVIERRVNTLGVSEPLIQTTQAGNSWRVTVELAGIKSVNDAIKLIGETPILEFKEVNEVANTELTEAQKKEIETKNAEEQQRAVAILDEVTKNPASFEAVAREKNENAELKTSAGDLGFIAVNPDHQDLYEIFKRAATGTIAKLAIERPRSYSVARAEEVKSLGNEIKVRHLLVRSPEPGKNSEGVVVPLNEVQQQERAKALAKITDLKARATPQNFIALIKEFSDDPTASSTNGELDWVVKGQFVDPAFEAAAFAAKQGTISEIVESQYGFHLIEKIGEQPKNDVRVRVIEVKRTIASDIVPTDPWKATKLTGKELASARVEFDPQVGTPLVSLQFNDEGARLFEEITRRNIGKPVGIFLDGVAISTPIVQAEIAGGRAVIQGSGNVEEAKVLARRLQAGALPVGIKLIAQQTVGPTLGADSLTKSLSAGLYGFLFVALFMILLYRLPGLVSILALVLYAALSAAAFKLIPITLTLAGIAGFILSLGIAVDANVLVFERLKEELKLGKSLLVALEESFRRAWPSIRDGHVTVLISCIVLYGFSSSVIRGFALTLVVGTLISLFTAIVATRTFLRFLAQTKLQEYDWIFLRPKR